MSFQSLDESHEARAVFFFKNKRPQYGLGEIVPDLTNDRNDRNHLVPPCLEFTKTNTSDADAARDMKKPRLFEKQPPRNEPLFGGENPRPGLFGVADNSTGDEPPFGFQREEFPQTEPNLSRVNSPSHVMHERREVTADPNRRTVRDLTGEIITNPQMAGVYMTLSEYKDWANSMRHIVPDTGIIHLDPDRRCFRALDGTIIIDQSQGGLYSTLSEWRSWNKTKPGSRLESLYHGDWIYPGRSQADHEPGENPIDPNRRARRDFFTGEIIFTTKPGLYSTPSEWRQWLERSLKQAHCMSSDTEIFPYHANMCTWREFFSGEIITDPKKVGLPSKYLEWRKYMEINVKKAVLWEEAEKKAQIEKEAGEVERQADRKAEEASLDPNRRAERDIFTGEMITDPFKRSIYATHSEWRRYADPKGRRLFSGRMVGL